MIRSYRDLKVWQVAMELVEEVYKLTRAFPREEIYALTAQMRRAAISVPSNVAEGHVRQSTREFLQHISIALGSLAELETQVLAASRLGYVRKIEIERALSLGESVGKMLHGLQKSLREKLSPSP